MPNAQLSLRELLDLLAAAIDGIDGYESETGDLRYWDERKINHARALLDAASTGSAGRSGASGCGSDTPR